MPTLLLAVLLSVFSPEPLRLPDPPPPPLPVFEQINLEWDTHAEGWETIFSIPEHGPTVTLEGTSDYVYRGMGSSVEQWRALVAGQFGDQTDNALCVINSESGGNPEAKNPRSNARGLFQIMTSVWGPYFGWTYEDFYNPELNVWAAARIWEKSGWLPWSPRTRRNCGL